MLVLHKFVVFNIFSVSAQRWQVCQVPKQKSKILNFASILVAGVDLSCAAEVLHLSVGPDKYLSMLVLRDCVLFTILMALFGGVFKVVGKIMLDTPEGAPWCPIDYR